MMRMACMVALVTALAGGTATVATAGSWRPGTNYMVSEKDASDWLESAFDHAYCEGVPRFGTQGEFPYEEYVVFDCSIDTGSLYCSDVRLRAVKGKRRGYFRLKGNISSGDCY